MNNIILIGMPASGKSTIGRALGSKTGRKFIDTDNLIEQSQGCKLQEVIDSKGNDYFWKVEEEVLTNLNVSNSVIATGGSAVYFPVAMEHLRKGGRIVYLMQSLENIKERLNNLDSRGVTLGRGQSITDLYNERTPLYEQEACLIVNASNLSVKEAVKEIITRLGL